MERRALGDSGLQVPVIGMGTWLTFDVRGAADIEDRRTVVDAALSAGTTLFDTSPMYGASEEVLGRLLASRRDQALVADKVWTSSAREGREQVEQALRWYGGRVDIYQVHNLVAWREHLPMLEELRNHGKVTVIGATHYQHSAFRELMAAMRTGRIQMIQVPYNAADRAVEREVLPLAAKLRLGVLVMQPLGTGTLVRRSPDARELKPLERFGVRTWAQALLKWIVSDARVHAVLPATRHAARATGNAVAGDPPWFDDEAREYVARLAAR
jgi:aryl-alcohol dehydrogenase-like predicted oxidoreductase